MSNRSSVDERTAAPSEASRRGAHRARPRAVPSGLPVIAGVAVILLVLGGAYYGLRDTSVTSTGTVTGADAESTPSASASAGASASASSPAASASRSATATRTVTPVDRTVPLVVLNSVSVQGLAARARSALESDSWTVTRTDNSTQKDLQTSVVYYGRSTLRSTARQIVKDLGYGQISFNSQIVSGRNITVVLGQDAV